MTLDEARTAWLTLLGSDWISYDDVMRSAHYYQVLSRAYATLLTTDSLKIDHNSLKVKIR